MCEWTIQWNYLKYFIITENTLCSIASCFVCTHVVISIPCSHEHISRVRIVVFKYCYSANSFYQVIPHTCMSTRQLTQHFMCICVAISAQYFKLTHYTFSRVFYYCMWSSPTHITCVLAIPSLSGPLLMLLVRMSYCIKES